MNSKKATQSKPQVKIMFAGKELSPQEASLHITSILTQPMFLQQMAQRITNGEYSTKKLLTN